MWLPGKYFQWGYVKVGCDLFFAARDLKEKSSMNKSMALFFEVEELENFVQCRPNSEPAANVS